MKLLSLNIWGGKQGQPFFNYIKEQSATVDIFCFQEVFKTPDNKPVPYAVGRMNSYFELEEMLPDYKGYFAMSAKNFDLDNIVDFAVEGGTAIFVKKDLRVLKEEVYEIYGKRGESINPSKFNLPTVLHRIDVKSEDGTLSIFNYHGVPYPGNKLDSVERVEHSNKIVSSMSGVENPKILCGDFNLFPETESVRILGAGMRDLIKEFKIENTRNEVSWKKYNNIQKFADFIFVSPHLSIKSFTVPYNLASDHLPMILEF